ncbi:MAG: hypothetical protein FJ319_04380 [SAR202 cluster bacterium]|nr:hypothetical protein [SAR202 cluster bacterium]
MKLPNGENCTVDRDTIADYLLSATHPTGQIKAKSFAAFGFERVDLDDVAASLLDLGRKGEVAGATETSHGAKYFVDGALESPVGIKMFIRTEWVVDRGSDIPAFSAVYHHAPPPNAGG